MGGGRRYALLARERRAVVISVQRPAAGVAHIRIQLILSYGIHIKVKLSEYDQRNNAYDFTLKGSHMRCALLYDNYCIWQWAVVTKQGNSES